MFKQQAQSELAAATQRSRSSPAGPSRKPGKLKGPDERLPKRAKSAPGSIPFGGTGNKATKALKAIKASKLASGDASSVDVKPDNAAPDSAARETVDLTLSDDAEAPHAG